MDVEGVQVDRLPDEPADESQASGEQSQDGQSDDDKAKTKNQAEDETEGNGEKPEGEEGEEESEGDDGEAKRRRASGYQRLKRRASVLLAENAELYRQLEEARRPRGAAASHATQGNASRADPQDGEAPPKETDFGGDYLAYERALIAYNVRQAAKEAVREEYRKRDEADYGRRQTEAMRERIESYNERLDEARERISDFDQAMTAMKGVEVRPEVIDEIMSSEKGPLIAYHLAKHPHELRDLNAMSGREIARAVGRLEGRLTLPRANPATKASPPLSIPRGGAAANPDPSKMSFKEYEAWRKAGKG